MQYESSNKKDLSYKYNFILLTVTEAVEYKDIEPFYYSTTKIKETILHLNPSISESEIESQIKRLLLSDDSYMMNLMAAIFTKHSD